MKRKKRTQNQKVKSRSYNAFHVAQKTKINLFMSYKEGHLNQEEIEEIMKECHKVKWSQNKKGTKMT